MLYNDFVDFQRTHYNNSSTSFICFKPSGAGLANKLNGLLGTLSLSILTRRVFLLCDWESINDYFEFSFPVRSIHIDMKKEVSNITYLNFFNNSPEIVTEMNLSFLFQHKGIVIGSNGNFLIFFLKNKEFQLTYKNLTKKLRNINYNVNGLVIS